MKKVLYLRDGKDRRRRPWHPNVLTFDIATSTLHFEGDLRAGLEAAMWLALDAAKQLADGDLENTDAIGAMFRFAAILQDALDDYTDNPPGDEDDRLHPITT